MKMPDALAEKIVADYEFLFGRLSRINPPEGHIWCREIEAHESGNPARSARVLTYGPRIWLRRRHLDADHRATSAIELRIMQRDNQDESVATIKMRIAWGCGGAGRSPEPT